MANKIKKVSISQMDKIVKELGNTEASFEWNGIEVVVKTLLSFAEVLEFAGRVVGSCFVDGEYIPEARDFAIRDCIVDLYSNIRLPDNLEHKYEILYRTDICQEIVKHINSEQYEQLLVAIDDKINVEADSNINDLRKNVEEMAVELNRLMTSANALFDGIDQDDIKTVFNAIKTNGAIDEEKFARAYFEAAQEQRDRERQEVESVTHGELVVKD